MIIKRDFLAPRRCEISSWCQRACRAQGGRRWAQGAGFLGLPSIAATNNATERAYRFGVMCRKRSRETYSEKGNRWVERVLSFRQTCRIRGRPPFPLLVETVRYRFKDTTPDRRWITHHEPLLACTTL
jgi:hypothetical protein